jgi:ech hydrogenase subunit E
MSEHNEDKKNRTIIPFGPQHPVLPEPIHLDLELEDERVVRAIPKIGFIHRGLEKLVEKREYADYVYVAERVCGICSFIHGMGYCTAVEKVMNVELPRRADYLRTFWSELSRVQSHILWLGLLADAFGFESLFMHSWRVREKVLDIFERTTGGRVIFSVCKVGGVRRDILNDDLKAIEKELLIIEKEALEITKVFENDASVKRRTEGVGYMSMQDAHELGAVGPVARASGIEKDSRKLGFSAYNEIDFDIPTSIGGDGYARIFVRVKEIYQSIDIIRQVIKKIPDGPVDIKVTGNPTGEYYARLEQPRGEAIYYVKGNGTKNLSRFRLRTPTFANIPALLHMLKDCQLADVPLNIITIDPCISCTER